MRSDLDPRLVKPTTKAAPPSHPAARDVEPKPKGHVPCMPLALIAPALFDDEQAAVYLGIGSRKFREMREAGLLPSPIVLGPRHLRWSRVELDAMIATLPRQSSRPEEPAWLTHARGERSKAIGAPA